MDSASLRILKSSLVELIEAHREAVAFGQQNYASLLLTHIKERNERYVRGDFFIPSDYGTDEDSSGNEQGG
jgi:hypothetical protein